MKTIQLTLKNEKETLAFGEKLASLLKPSDIIVLTGDLGAGKTKFVQGILKYFNLENEISSPTFTIVNEYNSPDTNIYHFDVYRLADVDEFYAIGGEEYFSKGICIIEWGEIIENILPKDYYKISINKSLDDENIREIIIEPKGNKEIKL